MLPCNSCYFAVLLAFLLPTPNRFEVVCNKTSDIWMKVETMTGLLFHNCLRLSSARPPQRFLIILQECLKQRTLLAFDRMLGRDVIELADGVTLVKYQEKNDNRDYRAMDLHKSASRFDEKEESWKSQVVEKLTQLFRTHVLKIQLRGLDGLQFEGRRRHKKSMMSELLMFALIAAGVIVIPLGFQFLAILGGKALLLAKMALLMTSIQGLKKIATRHYDRQWPYEAESHAADTSYGYENNHHYDILHPRQDLI